MAILWIYYSCWGNSVMAVIFMNTLHQWPQYLQTNIILFPSIYFPYELSFFTFKFSYMLSLSELLSKLFDAIFLLLLIMSFYFSDKIFIRCRIIARFHLFKLLFQQLCFIFLLSSWFIWQQMIKPIQVSLREHVIQRLPCRHQRYQLIIHKHSYDNLVFTTNGRNNKKHIQLKRKIHYLNLTIAQLNYISCIMMLHWKVWRQVTRLVKLMRSSVRSFVSFVSSGSAVDCWQSFDVPSATASAEA